MDKNNKIIIALIVIIAFLAAGVAFGIHSSQNVSNETANNTTVENSTVINATMQNTTSDESDESGQYGYCAICGRALTYEEANDEYTQGKVCHDCASNPYYETGEGAEYANSKLAEAYPDEYSWMDDDYSEDSDYDDYEYEEEYD